MECFHGGYEVVDEVLWAPVENLVSDSYVMDPGCWVKGFDMGGDPSAGGSYFGEGRDVAVGNSDGYEDAGVSEGSDDVGVNVEEFDSVYDGFFFKKLGYLGWWGQIVAQGTIVNTDGKHTDKMLGE